MHQGYHYSQGNEIHDNKRLKELQSLSLDRKIQITQARIIEWYNHFNGNVYVSFSGGKDSTVLADIAAQVCRAFDYTLILWFSDTGLEYPENKRHVKSYAEYLESKYKINLKLVIDYPKDKNGKRISFKNVIMDYGYPVISKEVAKRVSEYRNAEIKGKLEQSTAYKEFNGLRKMPDDNSKSLYNKNKYKYLVDAPFKISHKCCLIMKERPAIRFENKSGLKPMVATMSYESLARKKTWIQHGCNAFNATRPMSTPMSFWTEQDVLGYCYLRNIPLSSAYGDIIYTHQKYSTTGASRTGCVFCAFGINQDKNRFLRLKETHPQLYEYCMKSSEDGGLDMDRVLNYINIKH